MEKDPEPYQGTYKYYVKYRPDIPEKVINIIIDYFNIELTDRVLDLGCGTGKVALAMKEKCGEMVCLDPDPKMIAQAKKATRDLKTKFTWINRRAEELGEIKEKLGLFKVATSSRAFHRMEGDRVLKDLDDLIERGGGVTLFGDRVLWSDDNEWQQTLKGIIQKHIKEERRKGESKKSDELWQDILARSPFNSITQHKVSATRTWKIEDIIGYTFSTAYAAPYLFGDQIEQFKKDLKDNLLAINPKGKFQEEVTWSIVLGSRTSLK